jgi:hypothetical protein
MTRPREKEVELQPPQDIKGENDVVSFTDTMIPLFSELRSILAEAFELAPEGAVYVVDERMRASSQGRAGWRNCNLRTQFERIIDRAGLTH